jgi:hypothetical protein
LKSASQGEDFGLEDDSMKEKGKLGGENSGNLKRAGGGEDWSLMKWKRKKMKKLR